MTQVVKVMSLGTKARILPFDGSDSDAGWISSEGFTAPWYFFDFVQPYLGVPKLSKMLGVEVDPGAVACLRKLSIIGRRYLKGCLWAALLLPIGSTSSRQSTTYRGDSSKTLAAVRATNSKVAIF